MVKSNLHRNERSILSCLLCGILPLEVETGRYTTGRHTRVEREERFCKVSGKDEVEDEVHLVFQCQKLKDTRNIFSKPILLNSVEIKGMSNIEKFQWLLTKENIKEFSEALMQICCNRQDKLYKKT